MSESIKICDFTNTDTVKNHVFIYKNTVTNEPRDMVNPRAVVIEQCLGLTNIEQYLMNIKDKPISHHIVISQDGHINNVVKLGGISRFMIETNYSRMAAEFFGDRICPMYDHSKSTPHLLSPNEFCYSVLFLTGDGMNINDKQYKSGIQAVAYIMNRYTDYLTGFGNIISYGSILDESSRSEKLRNPEFFQKPEFFAAFKDNVDKLQRLWLEKYPINTDKTPRRYPEIETVVYDEK